MMHSRILTMLTALGLLMQAVLGAVSPAAVLCISHHQHFNNAVEHDAVPNGGCGGSAVAGGASACCAIQKRHVHIDEAQVQVDERMPIALTSPCADGCGMCVDVHLPQHDMFATPSDRLDVQQHVQSVAAICERSLPSSRAVLIIGRWGTGPPENQRTPDAAIIRTTRLLI